MSISMTQQNFRAFGLQIDPDDPTQAIPVAHQAESVPDESWDLERLGNYAATGLSEASRLQKESIQLGRRSTVQIFRSGHALSIARRKVPWGDWGRCAWRSGVERSENAPGGFTTRGWGEVTVLRNRFEDFRKDISVANNYTQFSQGIDHVTPEERVWIESQLDPNHWGDTPPKWDAPVEDGQVACEWSLDPSSPHRELGEVESFFWVHADSGDPEQVSALVRAVGARR